MIITISGKAGSGKSTVAKILSKSLGLEHYSIGDLMRSMASERGISLLELNRLAEKDKSIDLELDEKLKRLGREEDNFIVDGRLTAFFIPNAQFRIFLKADDRIRAERILHDKGRTEKEASLSETLEKIQKREESERIRYKEYYAIDYSDENLYNLVIDTSDKTQFEVVELILKEVGGRN